MDEGKYKMKFKRWMRPQGLIWGGRWNVANKGKRDRMEREIGRSRISSVKQCGNIAE